MGAGLLTQGDAEAAVDLALPSIRGALALAHVSGEGVLHLVVMDPAVDASLASFEDGILHERSIGDPRTWGADYRAFARAKAALAWRERMDTRVIQEAAPHRLRRGDPLLWGSAWREGVVVAASGAHPWFDEAFSHTVAAFVIAIARGKAREMRREALFLD